MTTGLYDFWGVNTTIVSGATWTGLYAPDGSWNIVLDSAGNGLYHQCGAIRVNTAASPTGFKYDPSGAFYASALLNGAPPTISPPSPNTVWITDSDGVYLIDVNGAFYVEA